jgi:hypothetical protein
VGIVGESHTEFKSTPAKIGRKLLCFSHFRLA